MNDPNTKPCAWRAAVTELARTGLCEANAETHVARCAECATWLALQKSVQESLGSLAEKEACRGPAVSVERAAMAAFDARVGTERQRRRARVAGGLVAAGLAVAALVAGMVGGKFVTRPDTRPEPRPVVAAERPAAPSTPPVTVARAEAVPRKAAKIRAHVASGSRAELPAEADAAPTAEPFVAIPYTLPLAAGERAWVVRMELPVEALAWTGLWLAGHGVEAGPVEADVVVGEDGRARAFRVIQASVTPRR